MRAQEKRKWQDFVPLGFIQATGSVVQWFELPVQDRLAWWRVYGDKSPSTQPPSSESGMDQ